jgi:hypothetical protein
VAAGFGWWKGSGHGRLLRGRGPGRRLCRRAGAAMAKRVPITGSSESWVGERLAVRSGSG